MDSLYSQSLADGIAALEEGRIEQAERVLSQVVRRQPDSPEGNLYLGLTHFRAGRAKTARPYLERAAKLAPASALASKMLGLVANSMGDLDGAVPSLGKACELDARDEESCYYFARTLYTLARYDAAREPFEKAIQAASPSTITRVHRAAALNFVALGSAEEAERHFLRAIQLAGRTAKQALDPRVDYGAFLFRQGRVKEAAVPLQQAVNDAPSSARANVEWGRVLLHMGKVDEAIASLEKAVATEAGNWNAHLLLGRAYLRMGRTAEGEKEMRLGRQGWETKR